MSPLRLLCSLALLAALANGAGLARAARVEEARPLMGTVVKISAEARDGVALRAAVEAAYREMARLTDMMNHYDPKSVVSAINDAAGVRPVPVPPELMEVLAMAHRLSERTGGAFDVTVGSLRGWRFRPGEERLPSSEEIAAQLGAVGYRRLALDERARTAFLSRHGMRIDLGGIAKLYIVHAGMRVLERAGVARAMVNGGGGDLEVIAPPRARPWRIGVRDPRTPQRLLGVLELARGFVASSGDYERYFVRNGRRYHHILDPRTGYPSEGPRGVTLTGGELAAINGLTVAIMVLGKTEGVRLIEKSPGVEGVIVDRDGSVWMSPGFRARLRPAPEAGR
ncbi:MAG TPA: FAD:protein FMN transferase [Burkholderiales bacterium]|nr:FAD:protein FMN transferase [Burkholderiales bacterium]